MIHKSDLLNVMLQHKDTKENIDELNKTLSGHRRVDFGTFVERFTARTALSFATKNCQVSN